MFLLETDTQLRAGKEGVKVLPQSHIHSSNRGILHLHCPSIPAFIVQGVFFNWSNPKNFKFFSVSKMFRTFKLVPP